MAALLQIILVGALGFGLGWLAKSAGRRVIALEELPDATEENKAETVTDQDVAADPKSK
jgi:hypothetical protein